jgi:HSP20 family molecular chaperone IbpA
MRPDFFDPIECLKKHLSKQSKQILEDNYLKVEDFVFDKEKNKFFAKCEGNNFKMKVRHTDERGYNHYLTNKLEPEFHSYKTNNEFIVKIDIPDMDKENPPSCNIVDEVESGGRYKTLNLTGQNRSEIEVNTLQNNRKSGEFKLQILLMNEIISLSSYEPSGCGYENGVLTIKYPLTQESKKPSKLKFK